MTGASSSGEVRAAPMHHDEPRAAKLLKRIVITIVVAGGMYVLTNVLDQDKNQIWQLTVSVVLGGAALIIQYLVEFEERLEAMEDGQKKRIREMRDRLGIHHRDMLAVVDDRFAKINDATELFSQVDRSVLRSDGVTRLARKYTQVGEHGSEIVKTFAQEEIARLASLMESLSNGTADCPGENHEWLIDLTTCAKRTLYATSTDVDRDFWSSEPAKRYLAAQGDAIKKRQVDVRRLFLVERPEDVTESLEAICRIQRSFGIDARIAVRELLEPSAQVTPLNDFIIFDGELCYETEPDVRVVPAKTTLKMKRDHVEERINRFNVLWAASDPADPDAEPEPATASG
ncbi:hypothetical protein NGF19_01905 [Streptomyces sp. RY43-2]|uniref:DUF6879 domain-containing protein n=1 Tax=Streptomyces macrolidinus TaxID=2952607 RepID=A0ABT0Z700_9ACTN|nr:hypothetical protein [Streptomyces macrolidinus]MCN9239548.1 hypothetical protein [Streptomyces macrolidinus]